MHSETQSLVHGWIGARQRGKQQYQKAAEYLEKLKALAGVGGVVQLDDGRKFAVVDTFDGAEQVRKMTIIDRFEMQEIK